jgi:hypothetical protein
MRRIATAMLLAVAVLCLGACATSSALVTTEKSLSAALDTVNEAVHAEYDSAAPCRAAGVPVDKNCSQLEALIPGAHKAANDMRTLFPPVIQTANSVLVTYRAALTAQAAVKADKNATPDQQAKADADVATALAALQPALTNVAKYVAQAQTIWTAWKAGK